MRTTAPISAAALQTSGRENYFFHMKFCKVVLDGESRHRYLSLLQRFAYEKGQTQHDVRQKMSKNVVVPLQPGLSINHFHGCTQSSTVNQQPCVTGKKYHFGSQFQTSVLVIKHLFRN